MTKVEIDAKAPVITRDTKDIVTSTPSSLWRENGEPDPHGERYNGSLNDISCPQLPCSVIAYILPRLSKEQASGGANVMFLTAGKERLRWLSRKLYNVTLNHQGINALRAKKLRGELTDDELANAFFYSESLEDLTAGCERILWLLDEIEQLILAKFKQTPEAA